MGQQREASLRICNVFQSLDILNLILFLPLLDTKNFTVNCEFKSAYNKIVVQWLLSISEKKVSLIFLPLSQKYPLDEFRYLQLIQVTGVWTRDHESNDAIGTILKT